MFNKKMLQTMLTGQVLGHHDEMARTKPDIKYKMRLAITYHRSDLNIQRHIMHIHAIEQM